MTSELALKRDGTMLGLKVRVVGNLGGYLNSLSAIPPLRMMAMAPGSYQIQNCSVEVLAVFTNTVPTGPYRGAGRPESVLNIERLIDKAARELGMDCLEIRRKNFIRPEQFPYRTGVNVEYDSGDYEKSLAEALRLSDYDNLIRYRDERANAASWSAWASRLLRNRVAAPALRAPRFEWSAAEESRCLPAPAPTARAMRLFLPRLRRRRCEFPWITW
jgi:CO/xanthine dehydrogenase Mo-binding subunit